MSRPSPEAAGLLTQIKANKVKDLLQQADQLLNGREAILMAWGSMYRGRMGIIKGVYASNSHGVTVCLMIYRKGTKEVLNSDRETRSSWPLNEIKVMS